MTATRRSASLFFITALITLAAFFDAGRASACSTISINNNTGAVLRLCLIDVAGVRKCFSVMPGSSTGYKITDPQGAVSAAWNNYYFSPTCTPCLTITGPTPVCATLCYDALTCTLNINPCPAPCLP